MGKNGDKMLEDAMRFAYYAHLGQYRKCNSKSTKLYVSHPLSVMDLVKKFGGTKEDMVVACLHDVIEDCGDKGYDYAVIESKFGKKVADRVLELTNKKVDLKTGKKLSEEEWKEKKKDIQLKEIRQMSPENQLVKACDQLHNMSDYKEYSKENIVHREEYIQKAYDLIKACNDLPIALKVYARSLYLESKDFFDNNNVATLVENAKLIRSKGKFSAKREYAYTNA